MQGTHSEKLWRGWCTILRAATNLSVTIRQRAALWLRNLAITVAIAIIMMAMHMMFWPTPIIAE